MGVEWLEKHQREAFIDFHNGAVATDLLSRSTHTHTRISSSSHSIG